jgi:hypothetical protein
MDPVDQGVFHTGADWKFRKVSWPGKVDLESDEYEQRKADDAEEGIAEGFFHRIAR